MLSKAFQARIERALADEVLRAALRTGVSNFEPARRAAWAALPDAPRVRARAAAIRAQTLKQLPRYLEQFTQQVERRGGRLFFARTAADACRYIVQLAKARGVSLVAKSKSMVSEEIGLNEALQHAGIRVVETDLGEFIVQLAGERPSHIITPAIHKRRHEIAAILHEHLGMPLTDDIQAMTAAARAALREVFLSAQMGITGVNFGIAETGTLMIFSNEGNARMVSTLPPIHVALMGLERLVPTWEDAEILMRVLPRSATGQAVTAYVSMLTVNHWDTSDDAPGELHVVIVDNGRSRWLGTPMEDALRCIRCGACLNVCPVYQAIGGHAYDSVYPGPIGAIVTPMLTDSHRAELAHASTLCGACTEVCPVGIPLHDLLVRWRAMAFKQCLPWWERLGLKLYGWIARHPSLWARAVRWGTRWVARQAHNGWIPNAKGPLKGWTAVRDLIAPQQGNWRVNPPAPTHSQAVIPRSNLTVRERKVEGKSPVKPNYPPLESHPSDNESPEPAWTLSPEADLLLALEKAWQALGVIGAVCQSEQEAVERVCQIIASEGVRTVLVEPQVLKNWQTLADQLRRMGLTLLTGTLPREPAERAATARQWATAEVGITEAIAAWADTGTLVMGVGAGRLRTASLLPPVHLALLRQRNLYPCAAAWVKAQRERGELQKGLTAIAITGPSRTADIEKVLTIGVHGPGRVYGVLIREP
ncbi:MAG: LutB/LldF family L-lactate oxidation iron-sulfur protein [Armatimonadota bacterium]